MVYAELQMGIRPVNLKRVSDIGLTHVAVRVGSLNSKELYTADFLIDTGALHSVAPASELERIGVQPRGTRTFELAGGKLVEYQFGPVEMSFLGELVVTDILFGANNVEPTLGRLALLSAGYLSNPRNQD